jgi:hypothetical protein
MYPALRTMYTEYQKTIQPENKPPRKKSFIHWNYQKLKQVQNTKKAFFFLSHRHKTSQIISLASEIAN